MYAFLINEMKKWIPKHIINRGCEYYEEGYVEDVEVHNDKVFALVRGNYGDYEVVIHLEDFISSSCECPYENYCKHMAAVVYEIQSIGEEVMREKLQTLEKEELIKVIQRLLKNSKNVKIVENILQKGNF
ncbi:SWIM zinc finger family protein [Bacillus cytotoxicus]|uniref:SWIM zinc finger family protein n=1 Tax=Bacillus cytotoxicus TaxID=580165 RepID=UPI00065FC3B5|nr:SWIM zinc finger family protein [Bacillus cytotoxicus]AWC32972.1 hypothetical protein CG482_011565 [Bacillus cytotoxicus]AWC36999.1 hypothetical protein CG481_011580 [Bacillus cytotoxicus]AWC61262.1 hypothetical protein CG474_011640 [Bacillus cytotoxicus]KMT48443.1 zinc finger SWIM domain-containing protein [Bacillus cytotoxicus]HDR7311017.1 SWIM zinc finger family protein [Bacillus cytotoxicus]